MIGLIIQAREGSTRLPKKMVLPFFKDRGILELLLDNLKNSFPKLPIVLATTEKPNDDIIAEIGNKKDVVVFRGEENNVLNRFIQAAENNNISKIIRICADNPFLDIPSLGNLIKGFEKAECDYITYQTSNGTPTIKTHFGFWAEGVSLSALKEVQCQTSESIYLEHVTNFIYENKNNFKMKFMAIPYEVENSGIRLTVDTKEDFDVAKEIFAKSKEEDKTEIKDIIKFSLNNKDWLSKMKTQINLNNK